VPHEQWHFRIDDMLTAIEDIESFVAGIDRAAFKEDRRSHQAVLWNFQIPGEAIQHIPASVREQYPQLHWELVRRTRNIIVHHYEKIDLDVIWEAIEKDLPTLRRQLEDMKHSEM
jgi:uncharacterized protein with HEPN domain